MKFRVANPPKRRKSRKGSRAMKLKMARVRAGKRSRRSKAVRRPRIFKRRRCSSAGRKLAGCKTRFVIMRSARKASRTRKLHKRRKTRRSNPALMIGNPRRRRRSIRRISRRHIRRSNRFSNPPIGFKDLLKKDTLVSLLSVTAGFYSATLVRNQIARLILPATAGKNTEFAVNVALKLGTAILGGALLQRVNKRVATSFAVGGILNASWDVIAFLTGYEVSVREYVTPINTARRLSLGCVGAGCGAYTNSGLRAYSPAFSSAWGKPW